MIRLAEPRDYPAVRDMILKFISVCPYSDYGAEPEKIDELIYGLVAQGINRSIILLWVVENAPVGVLAATSNEFLFNRKTIASEMAWWMDPGHRGGGPALKQAFEYWAKNVVHADYIHMSSLNTPKVNRYLERQGYRLTECTYVKEI